MVAPSLVTDTSRPRLRLCRILSCSRGEGGRQGGGPGAAGRRGGWVGGGGGGRRRRVGRQVAAGCGDAPAPLQDAHSHSPHALCAPISAHHALGPQSALHQVGNGHGAHEAGLHRSIGVGQKSVPTPQPPALGLHCKLIRPLQCDRTRRAFSPFSSVAPWPSTEAVKLEGICSRRGSGGGHGSQFAEECSQRRCDAPPSPSELTLMTASSTIARWRSSGGLKAQRPP